MKLSYTSDILLLAKSYLKNDYEIINKKIEEKLEDTNYYIKNKDFILSYKISKNIPLTKIYGFDVKVVNFEFKNIDSISEKNSELISKFFRKLKEDLDKSDAYFTIRLPATILLVLQSFNKEIKDFILCGGIVSYLLYKNVDLFKTPKSKAFIASNTYVKSRADELIDIVKDSFTSFRGQYHISHITSNKASEIYTNWIESAFNKKDEKIFISEHNNKIAGFHSYGNENDFGGIGILGAVSSNYRGVGAYRAIINEMIKYSREKNKTLVIGTQLNNYIVQGVWGSSGLIPFTSFYNIHLDKRKGKKKWLEY